MNANNQRPPSRAGILLGKGFAALVGGVAVFLVLACGTSPRSPLDAKAPSTDNKSEAKQVAIYDADLAHLWNRLHSALFVRTAVGGRSYGQDELDPLLWPKSKYLLNPATKTANCRNSSI